MRRLALVLLLGAGAAAAQVDSDYLKAQAKIEAIDDENVPAGATVTLSPPEVNAYARGEAAEAAGEGLKDIDVQLGTGSLVASGTLNPAKLPNRGSSWILRSLLQGEAPFVIHASVASADGWATVSIESLAIGGREIEQSTMDFLVEWIFGPALGTAKPGEPFELEHNVERVAIQPSGVEIKIAE